MSTAEMKRSRYGAAIVLIAPAVLAGGLLTHPYIGLGPPDPANVAAAVAADTTRWGIAHLMVAVGSGLMILAFVALGALLRTAGERRWVELAVPFAVFGSALFMLPPAFEFAPLVVAEIGGNIEKAQSALLPWFLPVLLIGACVFAVGAVGFAISIHRSRILSMPLTLCVAGSLAMIAVSRLVPLIAVQLYVQAAVGLLALWPLAYRMWRDPGVQPR
ncbi:hypothetical protein [Rhodococcus sp. NPDC058514]|uniref:hypothetical protein n=1 Tax=unclassified Rhodococcus (in: high G+C Gram-positive bacteria) TaxID=192944 RepID=UPI0036688FD8